VAERERVQQKPPGRLDAWDYVIRALSHMWLHTKGSHEAALDLLTSALRLDPAYARALGLHAWLSLWHMHQGWSTAGLSGVLPGAFEQALAAVRIDGEDAWAHLALGFAYSFRREHDYSVEQLRTALDLNPNFAVGHACLGLTLAYGGKGHEGVQHFEKQTRLNPRDPFFFLFTGARSFAHFMAGEYELGLEWGRRRRVARVERAAQAHVRYWGKSGQVRAPRHFTRYRSALRCCGLCRLRRANICVRQLNT
jgi:tetratricopeptide (TPR) repeat protein